LARTYLVLRGRLGLVLTAIRDDEVAARSSGVRVGLPGCSSSSSPGSAAGGCALLAISQLQVQPTSVFSVQWTAEMAFAVIIAESHDRGHPGTIVYMVLQQTLQSYNACT